METPPVDEKLETIYQDIIGNLIIIPDHRPKGIRSPPLSSLFSLMNPELTSDHMISLVRERLNQQLSGSEETDSNMRYTDALFYDSHLLMPTSFEIINNLIEFTGRNLSSCSA